MRVVPLSQVFKLDHDEPIPSVKGTVKKIYPRSAGTNEKGSWSFQNFVLTGEGTEITVKMKDREELPKGFLNRLVYIVSNQGEKGMSGVKAKDDEYKEKTTRVIWVTPSASIDLLTDEGGNDAPRNQEPPRQQEPPPRQSSPAPASAPAPTSDGNLKEVRATLMQNANLYLLCSKAVENVVAAGYKKSFNRDMDVQQKQGATASLFIQMTRSGMQSQMPAHQMNEE